MRLEQAPLYVRNTGHTNIATFVQSHVQYEDEDGVQSTGVQHMSAPDVAHSSNARWGLQKLIVAVTANGLMFGLNSKDAHKLWSTRTPNPDWALTVLAEFHHRQSFHNPQVCWILM